MQRELEARLEKLGNLFRDAEVEVRELGAVVIGSGGPTRRQRMRASLAATEIAQRASEASAPQVAALIRLAYVRAGREVDPKFTLDEDRQRQVSRLAHSLHKSLSTAAHTGPTVVSRIFTQLSLADLAQSAAENPTQSAAPALAAVTDPVRLANRVSQRWGLEQYARATLRNVTQRAMDLGTLAARDAAPYDLTTHASG